MRPWNADGPATTLRECGDLPKWIAAWCLEQADLTGFWISASPLMLGVWCRFEWGDRLLVKDFPFISGMPEGEVRDVLDRLARKAREAPRLP